MLKAQAYTKRRKILPKEHYSWAVALGLICQGQNAVEAKEG